MESTFNPDSYTVVTGTATSPENGLNPSTNTSSYATVNASSTLKYYFDIDLPNNMILDSISCTVRCWVNIASVSATIDLLTEQFKLGKVTITNTTSQLITIDILNKVIGDLDAHELNTISLNLFVGNGRKWYCYFGGADLTITYHLPDPAIKSVKIYKKISGTWEAQEDYSGLFTEID